MAALSKANPTPGDRSSSARLPAPPMRRSPTCPRSGGGLLSPRQPRGNAGVSRKHLERIQKLAKEAAALVVDERPEPLCEAVDEYIEHSETRGQNKPSTLDNKRYRLEQMLDVFGEDRSPSDILEDEVLGYLGQFGPGSVHAVATVVVPFLRWCARNGWPSAADAVPEFRTKARQRVRFLTDEEYGLCLHRLREYARQPRARAGTVDALQLLALVPLRPGEAATLRAPEVSACGRYLYLTDTKTGNRVVPISTAASGILKRRRTQATGEREYLFPGRQGRGHLLVSSLSHAWRDKIAKPIGLGSVCLYALRASHCSMALRRGKDLEKLRRILGHSTHHMTARYGHLADHELLKTQEFVEREILACARMQLPLPLLSGEQHPMRILESLTDMQRHLLCAPGRELIIKGPGQAQAARALVRQGLLEHVEPTKFTRTEKGLRVRAVGGSP